MTIQNCFIIFEKDFKKRNWIDWIKNHLSLAPPPHRFKGQVTIEYDELLFEGYDWYSELNTEFKISKESIRQLYYGYDDIFNRFQTRGFGLSYKPIRIKIEKTDEVFEKLYIVSDFNGVSSSNQILFEYLKKWFS